MSNIIVTVSSGDINISKALCDIIQSALKISMVTNVTVEHHKDDVNYVTDDSAYDYVAEDDMTEQQIEALQKSTYDVVNQANAVSTIMCTQPVIELKAVENVAI